MKKFKVDGRPQPKERPRYSHGHTYTPSKTVRYERLVAQAYIDQVGELFPGCVELIVTSIYAVPKSWSKKQKNDAMNGHIAPIGKLHGDVDNLLKTVQDGLNGVAYIDDKMVIKATTSKRYAKSGETEGIVVEIGEYNVGSSMD